MHRRSIPTVSNKAYQSYNTNDFKQVRPPAYPNGASADGVGEGHLAAMYEICVFRRRRMPTPVDDLNPVWRALGNVQSVSRDAVKPDNWV